MKTPPTRIVKSLLLFFLSNIVPHFCAAQQCRDTSFRKSYFAQNGLTIRSQITLKDGTILVNAFKADALTNHNRTTMIRLAADGTVIWSDSIQTGNSASSIEIQQIMELVGGTYLIAGKITENNNGKIFLAKVNNAGTILWRRCFALNSTAFNSPVFKGFYAVSEDPVTQKIVGSLQVSTITSGTTYEVNVIAAFDQNGINLWSRYFYNPDVESYTNFSGLEVINGSVITIAETALYFSDPEVSPAFLFTKINMQTGQPDIVRCYKVLSDPLDSTTATGSYINTPLHSQASVKTLGNQVVYYGAPIYGSLKDAIVARFDAMGNFIAGRNLYQHTNSPLFYKPLAQVYATPEGRLITLISSKNLSDTYITIYDSLFRIEQQQKISSLFFNFDNSCLFKNISTNSAESLINLLHNYRQPDNQGGFLYHFEFQKFFIGQSAGANCFGSEGIAEILSDMQVQEKGFNYQSVYDVTLSETVTTATLTPQAINPADICSYYSDCNSVKIIQAPMVCNFKNEYTFKATKGGGCNKRILWSFLPVSHHIISQVNDSTIGVSFADNWQGKIIASLSGDCNISDTLNVSLQISPDSVFLGDDIVFCPQSSYTFDAGDDFKKYTWSDGSHNQHLTVSSAGTYWVIAENYCGDLYRDTINVTVSGYSLNIDTLMDKCGKDSIRFVRNHLLHNYTISPDYNYSINANEILFWPQNNTTYTVTAITPDGCTLQATMKVAIKNSPPLSLGADRRFCVGDSVELDAGNLFNNYLWNDGYSGAQRWIKKSGHYYLSATYSNGCIERDTIIIYPPVPLPVINLSKKTVVCNGQSDKLVAPSGYDTYLWQDGSNQLSYTVSIPGRYFVTVTNKGCSNSDTVQISKIAHAVQDFLPSDTAICYTEKITICSKVTDIANQYLWNNNSTGLCTEIVNAGIYSLQITNKDGCVAKERIEVREKKCSEGIFFPKSFTPNADNLNDTYKPATFSRLKIYRMNIYNRWGQRVFTTMDITKGWDGKLNGVQQEQGGYIWICEYSFDDIKKINTKKGTVLLLR